MIETHEQIFINLSDLDDYLSSIPRKLVNPEEHWIKHVNMEGARFHVLSWSIDFLGRVSTRCSEKDCILNKEEKYYVKSED